MKQTLRIVVAVVLALIALTSAFLLFTPEAAAWYDTLQKPLLAPPTWLFIPISLVVYVLLAFAFARVCMLTIDAASRRWYFAFGLQLAFNILWSVLFFSFFHALFLSMLVAIVLWFSVVILTLNAAELDRLAFWILIPYLAWITFATIVSVQIWWAN
jgi:benzodiazapine receptor